MKTHTRPSLLASLALSSVLFFGFGCGGSSTPDASVPTDTPTTTDTPVSDVPSSDAATPLYLLTVQGPLRAAAPSDGGAPDAATGDAATGDAAVMFNPAFAQMTHNGVVGAIRAMAMAAGDITHHVGLGQMDSSQFLALDTWNSLSGLTMTLSNPAFLSAFGSLFSGPPQVSIWAPATGYTSYIQPATNATRIILFVRGTLRSPGDAARMTHNGVVMSSMAMALAAGDVSHTVWLGQSDPAQFLAIDVWTSQDGLTGFLSNPMVIMALGQLFSALPTLGTYTPPAGWTTYGDRPAWGTI